MFAWRKTTAGLRNRWTGYTVEKNLDGDYIVRTPSGSVVCDNGQIAVLPTEGVAKCYADMIAWR